MESKNDPIDVSDRIDNSGFGNFHRLLIALCGACLIVDGFDVQAMSYVAPTLVQAWNIDKASLGSVFGMALVGMFLGSVIFSVVADRVGRRPVLILGCVTVGAFTLWTAVATSVHELLVLRFITGLGLGAIIPNAIALATEYIPARMRIALSMAVTAQFILGALLGGLLSAVIIPVFGWRSVFIVGGLLPLVIAAIMYRWLPESARFLIVRKRNVRPVYQWLRQIDPNVPVLESRPLRVTDRVEKGTPIRLLFSEGRGVPTLLLWAISFLDLLVLYFMANWLPVLMSHAGHTAVVSVLAGTSLQAGGLVGAIALGLCYQRFGFAASLIPALLAGTVGVALIGMAAASVPAVMTTIFVAGAGIVGTQAMLAVIAANYYPTALRSTGIGWVSGIGRIGSIAGPVLGGFLLQLHWPLDRLFWTAALGAALMTALAIVLRACWRERVHGSSASLASMR